MKGEKMTKCQIEEKNAGRAYPRTCPTCGLSGACAKGLDRGEPTRAEAEAALAKAEGKTLAESGPEFLARVGLDASKWAAEFRAIAKRLGYSDMDAGWLIGWFANAIEAARATAPAPDAARDERLWPEGAVEMQSTDTLHAVRLEVDKGGIGLIYAGQRVTGYTSRTARDIGNLLIAAAAALEAHQ